MVLLKRNVVQDETRPPNSQTKILSEGQPRIVVDAPAKPERITSRSRARYLKRREQIQAMVDLDATL